MIPGEEHAAYHGKVTLLNAESSHAKGYRVELVAAVEDDYKVFKAMTKRRKGKAGIIFRLYLLSDDERLSREVDGWFAGWSVSNADGCRVRFDLHDSADFDFFRELPAKAINPESATQWQLVLVEIDSDGDMVNQRRREEHETLKGGPLCRKAAILCSDREFQLFVRDQKKLGRPASPDECAEFIRGKCDITSRRELDHDAGAQERFHRWVSRPFAIWAEGGAPR